MKVFSRAALRKAGRAILAGAAAALASGCWLPLPQWGNGAELEVLLPPPPAEWKPFGALAFSVVLPPGREGEVPSGLRVAAGAASFRLAIEKGVNLPVLAYPLLEGRTDLLAPAGAVYPTSLDDRGRLVLSYREGFLAELLFPLYGRNEIITALNVDRLSEALWTRSRGDPWLLDRKRILVSLAYGDMSSDRIGLLPVFALAFGAPPGRWVAGDPFGQPLSVAAAGGRLELAGVATGLHRYFRVSELPSRAAGPAAPPAFAAIAMPQSFERIDLMVSEEGWLAIDSATGAVESGKWSGPEPNPP